MKEATKEKQFELLFSWDFDEMKKYTGSISDEKINDLFTITLDDVVNFLKKENLLAKMNYTTAGLQDGFWINVLDSGFEFIGQERGNIEGRNFFKTYDELLTLFAKILMNKIPKYDRGNCEWYNWKK